MLRSMTAYGRGTSTTPNGEFICELRSVNHRYLDCSVRVPDALRAAEPIIRSRLAAALQRGKVDVQLKYSASGAAQSSLTINEPLLEQLGEALRKMANATGNNGEVDLVQLLQWPDMIGVSEASREQLTEDALAVFELALQDFVSTREREGHGIGELLRNKAALIAKGVAEVRTLRPVVIERQREKWLTKLAILDTEHDESRLEQEIVYAAQRLDVDEELDRLDAHVLELGKTLERAEPVGRRLDFLMQEFNREANTLSSKSGDTATTAVAVDMKVLIEQMREQVQNVE